MSAEIVKKAPGVVATLAPGQLIPNFNIHDDKTFNELATSGGFLPRVQLFGSNSDLAKEGKIPMGTYGFVTSKEQVIPLGAEVDVLPICYRPKALDMSGDDVLSSYDPNSDLFHEIVRKADVQNSSCSFGPDFLIWVPSQHAFATMMFGSKTARREAPNLKALLGKAATLKVKLASNSQFKWHAPVVTGCSTPFDLPLIEDIQEQADKFNKPEEKVVVTVDPAATGSKRAR